MFGRRSHNDGWVYGVRIGFTDIVFSEDTGCMVFSEDTGFLARIHCDCFQWGFQCEEVVMTIGFQ